MSDSDATETAPWVWVIVDPADRARVVLHGVQWTRPYATPDEVAAERMAAHMWPYLAGDRRHQVDETTGLRCMVWRVGDLADHRRRDRCRQRRPYGQSTADAWTNLAGLTLAA